MVDNVFATFVSQKVNKIRWKPDGASNTVVTGSWDEFENKLSLWKCVKLEEENFMKLKSLHSLKHEGDVMELKFIDSDSFAVSSSTGSVGLYKIYNSFGESQINLISSWNKIHCYCTGESASGTDIACFEDIVISVGEDGRIVALNVKDNDPYRIIENADSSTIRCVAVNKLNEVITGNSRGQIKIWDLRNYTTLPEASFTLSGGGLVGFTKVICHPTQTHIKLAGGEDGTITVWDLRNNKLVLNSVNAHSQSVNELIFHPARPEHLYSCSSNGQLWHWDSSKLNHSYFTQFATSDTRANCDSEETGCSWMSKNLKNRITVYSLLKNLHLPINSLDVKDNCVVCSCDNEAVYLITD